MAVPANQLGTAISLENRSTGNQPEVFLHGLQAGEAAAFRRSQIEAQAAEKKRKNQEEFQKHIVNEDKFTEPEVVTKADKDYKNMAYVAFDQYKNGNFAAAQTTLANLRKQQNLNAIQDENLKKLSTLDPEVRDIYRKAEMKPQFDETGKQITGADAIQSYYNRFPYKPQSAVVDPNTGLVIAREVPIKKPEELISDYSKDAAVLEDQIKTKVGTDQTGEDIYKIDKNSPDYIDSRKKVALLRATDTAHVDTILKSKEFDKEVENFKKISGRDPDEHDIADLLYTTIENGIESKVNPKYSTETKPQEKSIDAARNKVWFQPGYDKTNWTFGKNNINGRTTVEVKNQPNSHPEWTGIKYEENGNGKEIPIPVKGIELKQPELEFNPKSRRFIVIGADPKDPTEQIQITVSESEVRDKFKLSDKGMENFIGNWYPKGSKEAKEVADNFKDEKQLPNKMKPINNPIIKRGTVR